MDKIAEGQSWEMHRTSRSGDDRYWVVTKVHEAAEGGWFHSRDEVSLRCVGTDETKRVSASTLKSGYTLHYDPEGGDDERAGNGE